MENTTLYISVHDSVSVSEALIIELFIVRLTTTWALPEKDGMVVSVAEYRKLLGDQTSPDERIVERLQFLEAFCRNIIQPEIKIYATKRNGTPKASTEAPAWRKAY